MQSTRDQTPVKEIDVMKKRLALHKAVYEEMKNAMVSKSGGLGSDKSFDWKIVMERYDVRVIKPLEERVERV